jgi:3-phenylpropionate/trans-cinnamate dioxygenase ferredoxin subunit
MVAWVKVCTLDEGKPGEAYTIDCEPPVAVFNVDGEYYAVDDTCTQGLSSLSEGFVDGCAVECIWHNARFDLRTGKALYLPATQDLDTNAVRVDNESIYVDLPDSIAETTDL